jgi:hypothetical protein
MSVLSPGEDFVSGVIVPPGSVTIQLEQLVANVSRLRQENETAVVALAQ